MPTVLVTGANRGIGLEFVKQYATRSEEDAVVFACCRRPDQAAELNAFAEKHENVHVFALDVTAEDSVRRLRDEIGVAPIDILINNAGVIGGKSQVLGDMDYQDWAHCLDVNTFGAFRMVDAFVDNVATSEDKKIASISSGMGEITDAGGGYYAYRTSKAALNMVMKALSADLRDREIVCLALDPGWVLTDMGGPNAKITAKESVTGMRNVIAGATLADSGKFLRYTGEIRPW
ncbi:MAG: SDR family oxidoreductase [Parvularculaceae bacterium]